MKIESNLTAPTNIGPRRVAGLWVTCPQGCGRRQWITPSGSAEARDETLRSLEAMFSVRLCRRCGDRLEVQRIACDERGRIAHDAPDDVPGPRAWPSFEQRLAYWLQVWFFRQKFKVYK